jgi:hypothetical protein
VLAASTIKASTSETPENFYQTTRRNNPEDSYLFVSSFFVCDSINIFRAL